IRLQSGRQCAVLHHRSHLAPSPGFKQQTIAPGDDGTERGGTAAYGATGRFEPAGGECAVLWAAAFYGDDPCGGVLAAPGCGFGHYPAGVVPGTAAAVGRRRGVFPSGEGRVQPEAETGEE